MHSRAICILLLAISFAACEPAETIQGRARVIDGDSLEIGSTSIRLFGVDAFEGRQTCLRNGRAWRCGDTAAKRLEELIGGGSITCLEKDIDQYGRTVALCLSGGLDLAAELARSGLALAYRQYSNDYADEEAQAQAAERGAWAGEFQAPWDWRRSGGRDFVAASAPVSITNADCLIKGNINRRGDHIYHVPGSSSYDQTIIDTSRGERWFCSVAQAQSAGWRAPRGR